MVLSFLHIPEADLYVSEPPPHWFGNPGNAKNCGGWTNENWLKSRFHFSFAEYRNPKNTNFGCLRVMNDDLVQGERGFGMHPHRDVEIVTYIVEGELTHQDSMGTRETLGRGSVQYMTAGTGIQHSEHNLTPKPLRFVQIWITPREQGLEPAYGGFDGTSEEAVGARRNQLSQLVGDRDAASSKSVPVKIAQDLSMYVAELEPSSSSSSSSVELTLGVGRQAYLVCLEGEVSAVDAAASSAEAPPPLALKRHDAAEIRGDGRLVVQQRGGIPSHILLLEMAKGGGGRGPGKWPLHMG